MSMVDTRQAARAPVTPWTMSGRVAALAGVVSFVLMAISFDVLGYGPDPVTDSARRSSATWHFIMASFSSVPRSRPWPCPPCSCGRPGCTRALRRAEGGTPGLALAAFGGAVLTAASNVALAVIAGTAAARFHDLGPAGARVSWTMLALTAGGTFVGMFVLIGATAIVCLRAHLFPRWFAVASTVLALASAVGACSIGYIPAAILVVGNFAFALDAVWILMVSVYFWRDPALTAP